MTTPGTAEGLTPAGLEAAILAALPGPSDDAIPRRELQGRIGAPTDALAVLQRLRLLRDDGLVQQVGRGRFSTWRLAASRPPAGWAPLEPVAALPPIEPTGDGWDELRRLWREDLRRILAEPNLSSREAA